MRPILVVVVDDDDGSSHQGKPRNHEQGMDSSSFFFFCFCLSKRMKSKCGQSHFYLFIYIKKVTDVWQQRNNLALINHSINLGGPQCTTCLTNNNIKTMGAHTSPIQDLNIFLLIFGALGLAALSKSYVLPRLRAIKALKPLFAHYLLRQIVSKLFKFGLFFTLGLGLALEFYYYSSCPVSSSYYETNKEISKEVVSALKKLDIPFWPDFASLLNVLR